EPRPHLGAVSVPYRLDQQLTERASGQGVPEHVEHLATERLPLFLQLVEEARIHLALTGVLGHKVPHVADLGLPDAMNAPEALLDAIGVPREVVVDEEMCAL